MTDLSNSSFIEILREHAEEQEGTLAFDMNEAADRLEQAEADIRRLRGLTIAQQVQEVVDEMCTNYCKYPCAWDEDEQGIPLEDSDVCANCPLSRLV